MAIGEIKQGSLRERDVIKNALRLRGVSSDKLAIALNDLNSYIIKTAIYGIRAKKPGIKKAELSREIRLLFAKNADN